MPERQMHTVTVVDTEDSREHSLPDGTLVDAIQWFTDRLCEVPEEYRAIAEIDFDASGYEGGYPVVRITYDRLETDEEMAKRIADEERYDRIRRDRELKAKYGDV